MRLVFRLLLLLQVIVTPAAAATYSIAAYYADSVCSTSNAYQVHAIENATCTAKACSDGNSSSSSSSSTDDSIVVSSYAESVECSTDFGISMSSMLSGSSYVIVARFQDDNCASLYYTYGTTELDTCVENKYQGGYSVSMLNGDGSASIQYFSDPACSSAYASVSADRLVVASHECSSSGYTWYSSSNFQFASDDSGNIGTSSSSTSGDRRDYNSGNNSGTNKPTSADSSGRSVSAVAIVSLVFSCIVFALVGVIVVLYRRLKMQTPIETRSGLWDDDTITATRIARNKIAIKKLLCRGAFGEVYTGVFNRQNVAVKMLLPATRTDLQHVNEFLTEAKMTATMDHPHIVYFVGVAWDSLSDLCVVLEFMDGGDLRTLLNKYETVHHPIGLDRQKATVALHICHALTYLHSLSSPVIHRDLKSRNVLLNKSMMAKLTDFGVSRERLDRTMTAGVGTSLWMAPEVMLGEKYDVKADMFSFGVVLSELDVHTIPYTQVKQKCREMEGREIADATLLQRVSTGEVCVEFSSISPSSIVELGRACVSVEPGDRPTAAMALYRLQVILSQELA